MPGNWEVRTIILGSKKSKAAKKRTRKARKKARKDARKSKKKLRKDTKARKKKVRETKKKQLKKVRKSDAGRKKKKRQKKEIRKSAKTKKKSIRDTKKTRKKAIKSEKKTAIESAVKGWSNWLGDLTTRGRRYAPAGKKALENVIQAAADDKKKLKVVGSGHSHSKAAQPVAGERYVDISKISGLLDLDEETFRKIPAKNSLARVKAGTRLQALTSQLLAPKGLGVINMGSFDGQTVAGAVNTNTHGTGARLGAFGDMVRSADMFVVVPGADDKPKVELWRIEPKRGLTNPSQAAALRKRGIDRLVQNDDVFYSAVVGYGAMGIAYSYVLDIRDLYWLTEKTEATSLRGLKSRLPGFLNEARHTWAFVNLAWTQVARGDKKAGDPGSLDETPVQLLLQTEIRPRKIPANFKHEIHPLWPPMRKRGSFLKNALRNVAQKHLNSEKRAGRFVANAVDKNFIETDGSGFFHTKDRSAYYRVLRRSRDEDLAKASAPKSKWDNTRIKGSPEAPTQAISMEICVPADKTGTALDAVLKAVKGEEINYSAPMGVRFTAGSKHYLSAAFGRPSAFMELAGVLERKKTFAEDLNRYKKSFNRVYKRLEGKVPGLRPHLGKHQNLDNRALTAAFPKAREWMAVHSHLNYSGIWISPFVKDLGLAKGRKSARATRAWIDGL